MPVYEKKGRKGPNGEPVQRIVVWVKGKSHEKLFLGTKKDARVEEARWRVELESSAQKPQPVPRVEKSFSAFCVEDYKPHAKAHLRPRTWAVRRHQLATLCDRHKYEDDDGCKVVVELGKLKLTEITVDVIDRYKAARTAEGAKPGTINTELAKYVAVRSYAKELGVPCVMCKIRLLPAVSSGRPKFWTEEQLHQLYAAVEQETPDLLPVVVFLVNTGCREGEAIACERSWIDLKRRLICIEPNPYWQPKNGKPREIPISDALLPYLEHALAASMGKYVFTTSRKRKAQEKSRWACWPKKQFNRARKFAGRCGACREADPKGQRGTRCEACAPQLRGGPHTLRHTFASRFLEGCPDMFLLSQVLGHGHESVTRLYAHLLPTHLDKARNVVNVAPPTPAPTVATVTVEPIRMETMAIDHGHAQIRQRVPEIPERFRVGAIGFEPTTPTVSR
jgi:integrase